MVELGICDGDAAWNLIARLMMVRDADVDALGEHPLDLVRTADAAVNGHDQVRGHLHAAADGLARERIALVVPMRYEAAGIRTKLSQAAHRHRGRRDAVDVEVTED